jgi:abelson tyrosine-protein kinase 1
MNPIRSSWDPLPSNRPSFEQIAREIKMMRAERLNTFPTADSPKPTPLIDEWGVNPYRPHQSPDILPRPLPDGEPPATPLMNGAEESAGYPGSALGLVFNPPVGVDPSATGPTRSDSVSSDTVTPCASIFDPSLLASRDLAPLDAVAARYQDERRYRMLLQHDYHTLRESSIPFMEFSC